ncbi:hypothetical protein LSO9J_10114 [Candidatus Liberibacter solanacearum]
MTFSKIWMILFLYVGNVGHDSSLSFNYYINIGIFSWIFLIENIVVPMKFW